MLHIHNGDISADTARQSSLPGNHSTFREALVAGPTPTGLSTNEWREVRAQHLSEAYGVAKGECEQVLIEQEAWLASFVDHDEVVLWFENDLFCQVHLIYLLDWFSQQQLGHTRLSMVCIDEFPGRVNFRGLGELTAPELASLFPGRSEVTLEQLQLATQAWRAYRSSDPGDLQELIFGDTQSLPFLKPAIAAHLKRFPSTLNGLGQVENSGLGLINGGAKRFVDLFSRFVEVESIYGFGDSQFWLALRGLSEVGHPLVAKNGNGDVAPEVFQKARFDITEHGRKVLEGSEDFVQLNGIDLWLGGVHLCGNAPVWRWDNKNNHLVVA